MIEAEERKKEARDLPIEAIRILLFRVMGVRMGVDVEQTAGMLHPRDSSMDGVEVFCFHERVLFHNKTTSSYVAPMVLLVKGEDGRRGFLIDEPEDIVTIGTGAIRPMPALIEACGPSGAIWGVALVRDEMVLLVDLFDLMRGDGS